MLKKHKNTLLALIGIILVFFGYWYFVLSKKNETTSANALVATNGVQGKTPTGSANSYDKEFVANLQTVRYIDLDTEIFNKPAYKALSFPQVPFAVDYNIEPGRKNPFLPLGVEVAGSAQSQPTPAQSEVQATTTPVATSTATTTRPRTTR